MISSRLLASCALLAASSAFVFSPVPAAEIDSVTTRRIPLDDSLAAINEIFNRRLSAGVTEANLRQIDVANLEPHEVCDEERLYSEIRKAIFDSLIPRWGLRGYDLDRQLREQLSATSYSLPLNDSIYRDIGYLEGFSLRLKELSDVVKVDGHLIGLDKLGHFFAEGWEYFEQTHRKNATVEQAIQWGSRQEAGKFGYATTGVSSYADLVANFNGWRFWNEIVGSRDDPLKDAIENWFSKSYIECEYQIFASIRHRKIVKAWELNRAFNLADYVDGAWDEGNNCNSYADPMIEEKVVNRVEEVATGHRCPIEPMECLNAQRKYGSFAKYLLHPRCLGVAVD